ncbi:MAG: TIGR00282 family metallophosphoesterase [Firmicutes bacterium]|nr:TIGR00282 family metallophosphoesterase [Dethiobacter sp.]MBS3888718.1 TIGR00282 family metallophosphoesterase [Bacillota bacterium]
MLNILFLGDIVGRPGREVVKKLLPGLRQQFKIHYCIANGENAAHGTGLTKEIADELLSSGIDVLTGGNHTWDKKEILTFIDDYPRVVRPQNYPPGAPGQGVFLTEIGLPPVPFAVVNLMGRVFMPPIDCPFRTMDAVLQRLPEDAVVLVDFHAEATSEKQALGFYLDGRVAAVIGTHTHVQTADERILPKGTAFLSDVGMCGPHISVLGVQVEQVVRKFVTGLPARFEIAEGPVMLCGVVLSIDPSTRKVVAPPERILRVLA